MLSRTARAIALGGLTVGLLDGLDAVLFFGARGVPPDRIFQAIAGGLLGKAAFSRGALTTALGVALHFLIATTIVAVCVAASRRLPALVRRPFLYGPLYGLAVYLVMNLVVIPLSAAGGGNRTLPVVLNGVLIHLLGVGLPAVLWARAASLSPPSPRAGEGDRG